MEMIDLVKPSAGELDQVEELIHEHVRHTESELGQRLLDTWHDVSKHFVKVFPKEYRRVLEERAQKVQALAASAEAGAIN